MLTRTEEIFMTRAALQIRRANPQVKAGAAITQAMIVDAFKAERKREQLLIDIAPATEDATHGS